MLWQEKLRHDHYYHRACLRVYRLFCYLEPMADLLLMSIRAAAKAVPAVVPHLQGRARWLALYWTFVPIEAKTYDYYLRNLERLIKDVYRNDIGGEFIDIMANLVQGQITRAYGEAWKDSGNEGALPDYLQENLDNVILAEYDHVDQFYKDIVDARLAESGTDALMARAELWANRYNDAYNMALLEIRATDEAETGNAQNMAWALGSTENHCDICSILNGVVASATVWKEAGIFPQSGQDGVLPNPALVPHADNQEGCGGWKCDCGLSDTDEKATVETALELRTLIGWAE